MEYKLSIKPIRITQVIGVLTSFFSFCSIIWVLWAKFSNNPVAGWAHAIVSLLGGVQLISLYVIGEYIGKIYLEARVVLDSIWRTPFINFPSHGIAIG